MKIQANKLVYFLAIMLFRQHIVNVKCNRLRFLNIVCEHAIKTLSLFPILNVNRAAFNTITFTDESGQFVCFCFDIIKKKEHIYIAPI